MGGCQSLPQSMLPAPPAAPKRRQRAVCCCRSCRSCVDVDCDYLDARRCRSVSLLSSALPPVLSATLVGVSWRVFEVQARVELIGGCVWAWRVVEFDNLFLF